MFLGILQASSISGMARKFRFLLRVYLGNHVWKIIIAVNKIPKIKEFKIERPERLKLSPEEALKRMQEFAAQRKEKLIAAVAMGNVEVN